MVTQVTWKIQRWTTWVSYERTYFLCNKISESALKEPPLTQTSCLVSYLLHLLPEFWKKGALLPLRH